jgi:hypothetical protein
VRDYIITISDVEYGVAVEDTAITVTVADTAVSVTVAETGAQGPPGPGMPTGGTVGQIPVKASGTDYDVVWADQAHRHVQSVAAATWTVTHNLGRRPAVTVTDSSGRVVLGDVLHLSTSAVEITFSAAFAGEALCN